MDPLANPVWHALAGPHRDVAESAGLAARYGPELAPFAALPDTPTPEAWDALGDLVGSRGVALLARADVTPPPGWDALLRDTAVQMVGPERSDDDGSPDGWSTVLTAEDVTAMLELVERTRPGPFAPRTIELGMYLGARDDGTLVAMAGERMRLAGLAEISAVCTDTAHRGRGLARGLVRSLVRRMHDRGDRPFLHVARDNVGAIRLYETLGFEWVRDLDVAVLRAPGR